MTTAWGISDARWQARALAALGPYLPEPLLHTALIAAQGISAEACWGDRGAEGSRLSYPRCGEMVAIGKRCEMDTLLMPRSRLATLAHWTQVSSG